MKLEWKYADGDNSNNCYRATHGRYAANTFPSGTWRVALVEGLVIPDVIGGGVEGNLEKAQKAAEAFLETLPK